MNASVLEFGLKARRGQHQSNPQSWCSGVTSLFLSFLVFAPDFRSDDKGGGVFQLMLVCLYFALAAYSWFSLPKARFKASSQLRRLHFLSLALLLYPPLTVLLNHVPLGNFLRLEARYIIFVSAIFMTSEYLRAGGDLVRLFQFVILGALLSNFTSIYASLHTAGTTLESARYHLFPNTMMLAFCLCVPMIRTLRLTKYVALIVFGLLMMYLSTTRGAVGAVAISLLIYAGLMIRQGKAKVVFTAGLIFCLLVGAVLFVGGVDRWTSRFNASQGHSADPTTLTRIAEYTSETAILTSSPYTLIFGAGLGRPYDLDGPTLAELVHTGVVESSEGLDWFEFGHSLYVYQFFALGLLGGWILPAMLVGSALTSFGHAWKASRRRLKTRPFIYGTAMACVALMIDSLIEHPMGIRASDPVIAFIFVLASCSLEEWHFFATGITPARQRILARHNKVQRAAIRNPDTLPPNQRLLHRASIGVDSNL